MTQNWDPETYAEHGRFVSDLGAPVSDLLDPRPGERILDLGCGDGALTERLRQAGCSVVAIDSSPEQVWAALQRGLDARIIDAEELPFDAEFDAVFSNAVLHWVRDVERLLQGVRRSLNVASRRPVRGGVRGRRQRGVDPGGSSPSARAAAGCQGAVASARQAAFGSSNVRLRFAAVRRAL